MTASGCVSHVDEASELQTMTTSGMSQYLQQSLFSFTDYSQYLALA